ncbi:MAG: hypothetical protein M4D80_13895 [Myxococcota bacterium]|nr:hypothetical protein [Myxococcota bacterium]
MKTFVVCAFLLFACSKAEAPDRWADVEKLAAPTVASADGVLLTKALDRVTGDDVPELALEDAIAWRKASGGLPWRGGRTMEDPRPLHTMRLGNALLERRGDDPEAVLTVLYLAQRLRAEAPALIDVTIGFTLAGKATTKPWRAEYAPFAPTHAEVLRAIPADAVHFNKDMPKDDQTIGKTIRAGYTAMLVGAPRERAAYVKHIEAETAKAQKSDVMKLVIAPKVSKLADEMFEAIEVYKKWSHSM